MQTLLTKEDGLEYFIQIKIQKDSGITLSFSIQ